MVAKQCSTLANNIEHLVTDMHLQYFIFIFRCDSSELRVQLFNNTVYFKVTNLAYPFDVYFLSLDRSPFFQHKAMDKQWARQTGRSLSLSTAIWSCQWLQSPQQDTELTAPSTLFLFCTGTIQHCGYLTWHMMLQISSTAEQTNARHIWRRRWTYEVTV